MTADGMNADACQFTHVFLAKMLGSRREAVTVAANHLQQLEIIRYHRGKITILDRRRLEKASCECYSILKDDK